MSQRKKLSGANQHGGSGTHEDDECWSFTQPSTSQVQKGLDKLSPSQIEQKTAEVVQYFLVKDQKKIPIRRADLVKNVIKEYKTVFPEILNRVTQTFDQVFGLKLVEIDPKTHLYILINKLEAANQAPPINSHTNPKFGLLFVILGVIFMKGGVVREMLIWNTLKKLRVDPGEKHGEFGDVKRLITDEFVRQRYLEYVRIPHTEPVEHEFRWGQRADMEVSKARILDFIGQLHEQEPRSWTQQYREAHAPPESSQASASTSSSTSSQRGSR